MNKALLLYSFLILSTASYAQWTNNASVNTPVAAGTASEVLRKTVSDGAGGIFVVWEETVWTDATTSTDKILVQRLDALGVPQFGAGISVSNTAQHVEDAEVIPDYKGGVIIAWNQFDTNVDGERISTSYDVYAQRITVDGQRLWGDNGVAVANAPDEQSILEIADFGDGGAVIGFYESAIKLQPVRGDGTLAGGPMTLNSSADAWIEKLITGNNQLTVIYSVEDETNEVSDYYMQRYDMNASPVFSGDGVKVFSATWEPEVDVDNEWIISDGQGGFFVLVKEDDSNNRLKLQHVTSAGTLSFPGYGLVVDEATAGEAQIIADGEGGVVVAWTDIRNGGDVGYFSQRFAADGTKQWASDVELFASIASEGSFAIEKAQDGGILVVVPQTVNSSSTLRAQKVSLAGVVQWASGGYLVSDATPGNKYDAQISLSNDNIIVAWTDMRSSQDDVYAQSIPSSGVLPVNLTKFSAVAGKDAVLLNWETASEENNAWFELEKSEDGKSFSLISKIAGRGTTSSVARYTYTDVLPLTGAATLYYRLKQVDLDGKHRYSEVRSVEFERAAFANLVAYPNPATDLLKVKLRKDLAQKVTYTLSDMQGRVLLSAESKQQEFTINVADLAAGVYFLQLQADGEKFTGRIVKN